MALRVLFPLDGSERSHAAMQRALSLLKGAEIDGTVLVVLTKGFENAPADVVEQFDQDGDDEIFPTEASATDMFRAVSKRMRGRGVRLKLKSAKGNVLKEILDETANHDLVVMHAMKAERSGWFRVSRTKGIAQKAMCSVLLVED